MRWTATLSAVIVAASVATTSTSVAKADPSANDWMRILVDVDTVARKGADVLDSPRCALAGCQTDTNTTAARPTREMMKADAPRGGEWLGLAPKASLVARDWGSAYKVAGDRLALVDALRLTSSTRMILARVRASDARISPFAQVGVGQWRTDPYLLPLAKRQTELAAQAAAGVEVRVVGTWEIGLESTMTMLYLDAHDPGAVAAARIWSTSIASRFDF